ncbi:KH domain-containing protein [Patescibacteria group bacterium]|nr:KH domain-containing protein [Patescibacteria group bacterium]MBU1472422.1 KH domain-containing protein [Patescibacteria group bacterium]MBU2460237.1 KH domain-containing protein [Patescibacteria group bacterium]MBU2544558.1 KH domain-containing protein [Patescibacteria group bacterium]
MKETLLFILQRILDHPKDIRIEEIQEEGRTILSVSVHPEDMGKIIGKGGRIIRAVRDIVKLLAIKHKTYADVVLSE